MGKESESAPDGELEKKLQDEDEELNAILEERKSLVPHLEKFDPKPDRRKDDRKCDSFPSSWKKAIKIKDSGEIISIDEIKAMNEEDLRVKLRGPDGGQKEYEDGFFTPEGWKSLSEEKLNNELLSTYNLRANQTIKYIRLWTSDDKIKEGKIIDIRSDLGGGAVFEVVAPDGSRRDRIKPGDVVRDSIYEKNETPEMLHPFIEIFILYDFDKHPERIDRYIRMIKREIVKILPENTRIQNLKDFFDGIPVSDQKKYLDLYFVLNFLERQKLASQTEKDK